MPTALSTLYCDQTDLESLFSTEGVELRLDDNGDGSVSAAELLRLTTQARNYATARVNMYCLTRYAVADLATSWVVNEWATYLACHWLSRRRGNPGLFKDEAKQVMEELKAVKGGQLDLADLAERNPGWPTWSNARVDISYPQKRIRVQRPISEQSPTQGMTRNRDIAGDYFVEPN